MGRRANKLRVNAEEVRRLFIFDENTGDLIWRDPPRQRPALKGMVAGRIDRQGRRCIEIAGYCYFAHRIVWLYVHGEWPSLVIDHVNRNPSDNRIKNLRLATGSQNQANRKLSVIGKSGVRGVSRRSDGKAWVAAIRDTGRVVHLGSFPDREKAGQAYRSAKIKMFGDFALLD